MTKKIPRLLIYISGHGYGHLAQVAPVLNRLKQLLPHLEIIVKTVVPQESLQARIDSRFRYIPEACDFGMVMASALDVVAEESMQAYIEFHADWDAKIALEARKIAEISPGLILSDVAYLPLAAAARAGSPSVAMCSLNWADILRHYCENMTGVKEILQQIEQAYLQSQAFLRLSPAMPMQWLTNRMTIGPVAQPGKNRRAEINQKLGLNSDVKLVLVSMGGVAMRLPIGNWPGLPGVVWLVQADWLEGVARQDMLALESLAMGFPDIFASCDLMLTKPGYGTFVEAACNGVPVLYVERDGWPEQPCLIEWLNGCGCSLKLDAVQAKTGNFQKELQYLLSQPKPESIMPTGVDQAVSYLAQFLS